MNQSRLRTRVMYFVIGFLAAVVLIFAAAMLMVAAIPAEQRYRPVHPPPPAKSGPAPSRHLRTSIPECTDMLEKDCMRLGALPRWSDDRPHGFGYIPRDRGFDALPRSDVPEPGSLALIALGLVGLLMTRRG